MRRGSWISRQRPRCVASMQSSGAAGVCSHSSAALASPPTASCHVTIAKRRYTPIWTEAPPSDALGVIRVRDEAAAVAPPTSVIADVPSAAYHWLRWGLDPVVDTQLERTSTFSGVEDYCGTNLVAPSTKQHFTESLQFWSDYFEKRTLAAMRQSRRTAVNHVGSLAGPDTIVDEADRPETTWGQDTFFKEVAFLSEKILKMKVDNLEAFERALRQSDAAAFLQFHEVFTTQTQTGIPLPSSSVWVLEGEQKKAWVDRYKKAEAAAISFFDAKLTPALALKQNGWKDISKQVADVFVAVAAVRAKRLARQEAAGIRKPWAQCDASQRQAVAENDARIRERSFIDGELDSEDHLDKSEDWLNEQAEITKLLQTPIADLGFTAEELWTHTIRLEEILTEHVYLDPRQHKVTTAAFVNLYDGGATPVTIAQNLAESIANSTFDTRSQVLIPQTNELWCKLHWAKYAGSMIVQHSPTAKRQLHYHHFDSPRLVAAAAALYYQSKPLSSSLDYASPYKYRKSVVSLATKFGVESMHAVQRPTMGAAKHLETTEDAFRALVRECVKPYGALRRSEAAAKHASKQSQVPPIKNFTVQSVDDPRQPEKRWALGSKRTVEIEWQPMPVAEHKRNPGTGADAILKEASLSRQGVFQIALMARRDPKQRAAKIQADLAAGAKTVEAIRKALPQLAPVVEAKAIETINRVLQRSASLTQEQGAAALADEIQRLSGPDGEWEFVAALDDCHPLVADGKTIDVYLPYLAPIVNQPLTRGIYRLRVRGYSHSENPTHDSALASEGFCSPFEVFDDLPRLCQEYFKLAKPDDVAALQRVDGAHLVPLCDFLRKHHMHIPTAFEFEVGQNLSPKGEIYFVDFVQRLRDAGKEFFVPSRDRYTEAQLAMESKIRSTWSLSHPGATDDEWFAARFFELQRAFEAEKDWWVSDDMLDEQQLSSETQLSTLRYCDDVCSVLSADGSSIDGKASATYSGSGTVRNLTFASGQDTSVQSAVKSIQSAIEAAHTRYCILAAAKTGRVERASRRVSFLEGQCMEFGLRHGRTYAYAFDKARSAVLEKSERRTTIEDLIREKEVDRFASASHPEQRKRQFAPRMALGNLPLDEVDPTRQSNWGNTV